MKSITMDQIHRIAGYVEAGEGDTLKISQDDVTKVWCLSVGGHNFRGSLSEVFDQALAEANEYHKSNYDMDPL